MSGFFFGKIDQKTTQKKKTDIYSGETRFVELRAQIVFLPIKNWKKCRKI